MRSLFTVLVFLITAKSFANDAFSGLSTGGIEFKKSDSISMESEELYLSLNEIKVSYAFLNSAKIDQKVIVSFPFPEVSAYDQMADDIGHLDFSLLKSLSDSFTVVVDGKTLAFSREVKAIMNGKDITTRLKEFGLDPTNFGRQGKTLAKLKAKDIAKLLQEGFVEKAEEDPNYSNPYYSPLWRVKMMLFWEQVFPAGKQVKIQHKYKPSVSTSQLCLAKPEIKKTEDEFCVDSKTRVAVDKMIDASRKKMEKSQPGVDHFCSSIQYILTSANTWSGPIKKFHLTIDKAEKSIVSTCFPGIKKVSATRFEAQIDNFIPSRELNVLFVYPPEL